MQVNADTTLLVDSHRGVTEVSAERPWVSLPSHILCSPGVGSNSGSAVWIGCKALSVLVTSF